MRIATYLTFALVVGCNWAASSALDKFVGTWTYEAGGLDQFNCPNRGTFVMVAMGNFTLDPVNAGEIFRVDSEGPLQYSVSGSVATLIGGHSFDAGRSGRTGAAT